MTQKSFAFLFSLCALVLFAGCSMQSASDEVTGPIKLGWISPLSGELANLGGDALASAEIAVEEINAAGGVDGRMIELIVENGGCNTKDGLQAGSKLMNIDQVPVLFAMCSPEVVANASVANQTQTVLFSSCASAPHITDAGDYIFRAYPSDAFQGKFAAEYAYNELGKRKAAVMAVQNDWGQGLKVVFQETFEALGGEIVAVEQAAQESRDLRSQMTKIKDANPDLVYFPAFTEMSIAGLKQAQEMGFAGPFLGGDAWDDGKVHESGYAEGIQYIAPKAQFAAHWEEKMAARSANATVCAPAAYDIVKITAEIIGRVGEDSEAIKDELYKVEGYEGVNGTITLDEHGDLASAAYDVKLVEDKKARILE